MKIRCRWLQINNEKKRLKVLQLQSLCLRAFKNVVTLQIVSNCPFNFDYVMNFSSYGYKQGGKTKVNNLIYTYLRRLSSNTFIAFIHYNARVYITYLYAQNHPTVSNHNEKLLSEYRRDICKRIPLRFTFHNVSSSWACFQLSLSNK